MEPSHPGAANARRVVLSTPTYLSDPDSDREAASLTWPSGS